MGDEVQVYQEEDVEEEPIEEPDMEMGDEMEMEMGDGEDEEGVPLQEMIDTITKRVAKRIIGEALKNKK